MDSIKNNFLAPTQSVNFVVASLWHKQYIFYELCVYAKEETIKYSFTLNGVE